MSPNEVASIANTEILEPSIPLFFPVSLRKLLVLLICTLGGYSIYWFYKNWQLVKSREHSSISPKDRAVFWFIFYYPLFCRLKKSAAEIGIGTFPTGTVIVCFIIISWLSQSDPSGYWWFSILGIFSLLIFQHIANRINAVIAPNHDRNTQFTFWNIVAVVLGGGLLALLTVSEFQMLNR